MGGENFFPRKRICVIRKNFDLQFMSFFISVKNNQFLRCFQFQFYKLYELLQVAKRILKEYPRPQSKGQFFGSNSVQRKYLMICNLLLIYFTLFQSKISWPSILNKGLPCNIFSSTSRYDSVKITQVLLTNALCTYVLAKLVSNA